MYHSQPVCARGMALALYSPRPELTRETETQAKMIYHTLVLPMASASTLDAATAFAIWVDHSVRNSYSR